MKKLLTLLVLGFGLFFYNDAQALLWSHECKDCHGVHHAPIPNVQLRWYSNIEQGCMSCHDGSGAVAVRRHEKRGSFLATCVECHEVHDNLDNYLGGTNIKMVGFQYPAGGDNEATVKNNRGSQYYKVAYESEIGSRAFANKSTADGGKRICEVCHSIPSSGGGGLHASPTRTDVGSCKRCHSHVDGWMP